MIPRDAVASEEAERERWALDCARRVLDAGVPATAELLATPVP